MWRQVLQDCNVVTPHRYILDLRYALPVGGGQFIETGSPSDGPSAHLNTGILQREDEVAALFSITTRVVYRSVPNNMGRMSSLVRCFLLLGSYRVRHAIRRTVG